MSEAPEVLLLHVVDEPGQLGGVERVLELLGRGLAGGPWRLSAAVNEGTLHERWSAAGLDVATLPPRRPLPGFAAAVHRLLSRRRPAVVHSQHRLTTTLAHLRPRRGYRLLHTFPVEQHDKRGWTWFGDRQIAVSAALRDHVIDRYGVDPATVEVVYNGVPPAPPGLEGRPPRGDDRVRAAVVARLTEQKGHRVLVEALRRMEAPVRAELEIVLVGDGPDREAIERCAEEAGVAAALRFEGHREDVYPYLAGADFALLPSLWEGFPLVVLEAFECGRPVVASAVAGVPEIVDETVGRLVGAGDPDALAAALTDTVRARESLPRLGEAALERVRTRFSLQRMVDGYARAVERLLAP
ncbi:MAG: glycosyltransferase family 4 protein [Thermoanaerobaculia bacterium]